MVRRPYRTTCRPFKDSDAEVTVHWYVVPDDTPTLPYPSRINSIDWRDNRVNPSPVGEVTFADRPFDGWGRIVPPIPGDHICGTRADFADGGTYLPDDPPFPRGEDGIPLCCRPEIGGLVVGGGTAFVDVWEAGDGGVGISGSAFVEPIIPGAGWSGALITPGVWYTYDSSAFLSAWFRWLSSVGEQWALDTYYTAPPVYGFGIDEVWGNPPFLADPEPWDVFTTPLKEVTHLARSPFPDVHLSMQFRQTNGPVVAFRLRGPL